MHRIHIFILLYYFSIFCFSENGIAQEKERDIQEFSLEDLLNIQISTASKYQQSVNDAPASVTIITSEDIERYGYRTLEEVFMSVRGFYVSNDRNYGYVGSRGFSRPTDYNNRILLMIDGHVMNERMYGAAYIDATLGIDLKGVERIEIVRGPGSSLYGTSAMFAVVNIMTKQSATTDGAKFSVESGSYDRFESSILLGNEINNGVEFYFSQIWGNIKGQDLYYEEYDDPATNKGVAKGLDWERYYGLQSTFKYHNFKIMGLYSTRDKGIPTGSWEMLFNHPDARTKDDHAYVELMYHRDISAGKNIKFRFYFDRYYYEGTYPYEDEPTWYDRNDNRWIGGELQFRWDVKSNNRLIFGVEDQIHFRSDYKYWTEYATSFDDNFPHNIFSFYLQDEYQIWKKLSFTLGMRRDYYSTVGSATTPRASIVFNPFKSTTLKLLYGEAFRAPSIYEANYDEPDYWEINPKLRPEKIATAEVVWEQRISEGLYGTMSYFNYKMRDLIDTIELPNGSFQYKNISKVKTYGLEAELNVRLKFGFKGYVSYAYQKAENTLLNIKLTNSPSCIVKAGLSQNVFNRFYAAMELFYESERMTVYDTKTDPYFLTNLNFSTKPMFNHLKLSVKIRDLFNVEYKTPGGFEHLQPAIKQNGWNFIVKMECSFD